MQTPFPNPEPAQITGLILAGGRARRMDNEDKGLLSLRGQPLIQHSIKRLQTQLGTIIISANRNRESYARLGFAVVADGDSDFAGPLAGILAGLKAMQTEWLQCVPCDNPWLPNDLVERMAATLIKERQYLAVPRWQNRLQPVYCLLHRSLATSLEDYLRSGEHKVQHWIQQQEHCVVDFADSDCFMNINTPEELQQAEEK